MQKLDGLAGNLVVRVPKDYDSNAYLYDFDLPEHKIFISDWLHLPADDHFPDSEAKIQNKTLTPFL